MDIRIKKNPRKREEIQPIKIGDPENLEDVIMIIFFVEKMGEQRDSGFFAYKIENRISTSLKKF